ncbi:nitrate/nitrite transport system ATP-binding protein [Prosthecobacter debontii]|uniref:Nitrate/nitrite transport system ATP-binding protein n=1 Tax=Prosthecobacter debontii TaxID=48467 RepID=A0A1T4YRB4_9BACT|nr:ABC transporter ATP-binding protein [Prosthecobacter debontii]SKB04270.1 nitrate/nitrite transport system ATP-binding protein [Prosthecobacter debontii]
MSLIEIKHVNVGFGSSGQRTEVLRDLNLSIEEGELVAIVGYSGSGKTTLVNLIAGLVKPDQGQVLFDGKPVTGPGPERGLVFQTYALLPWLSVQGNVALAVDQVCQSETAEQRSTRVADAVDQVKLTPATRKLPRELSGGMRQRVSVARALSFAPRVLLLDEPLSALDALTRSELQDQILELKKRTGQTILLITNDVDEALYMADKVIPLTMGPAATLGAVEMIDKAHPRDRATLLADPKILASRTRLLDFLIAQRDDQAESSSIRALPEATPVDIRSSRPTFTFRWAPAHSAIQPVKAKDQTAPHGSGHGFVSISQLAKSYPTPRGEAVIVRDFNLNIQRGELVSIIGHSGCGKSTVLGMVAGLSSITHGGIIVDGREIDGAGPDRGMVFQSPNLLPWMSALENVMLGVRQVFYQLSKTEQKDIAAHYLETLGLGGSFDKKPGALSQGMRQRVGLARAFALQPKVLLLDEPFGMLDKLTKLELQDVLLNLRERTGTTAIMVTHDVDEAIYLSDQVVMMSDGPAATAAEILHIDLPRPRHRKLLMEQPEWHHYREHLLSFLEERAHLRGVTTHHRRADATLLRRAASLSLQAAA